VRELLARGCGVSAATRQAAPSALAGLDVRVVRGDPERPGRLDAWVAGHDFVVDAAAPHPLGAFAPYDPLRAERRTEKLIEAVTRHGARLAFVGSSSTLPRHEAPLDALETAWRRGVYPYFRVKRLMEDLVLRAARDGLPAVVVNPGACLGPWEHDTARSFVHMVVTERLPVVARRVVNVIDVRDVARAVYAALEKRVYAVPIGLAGHNVAIQELAQRVAEIAGVAPPALVADSRALVAASFWVDAVASLTGGSPSSQVLAAPLIADALPMTPGELQRRLGVRARPLDETLHDAVAWHLTPTQRHRPRR
jgi:dihydroflavonol-4-reductase